jgi:hypothetical protein
MEDLKIMIILRVAPQAAHQPRRSSNLKDWIHPYTLGERPLNWLLYLRHKT